MIGLITKNNTKYSLSESALSEIRISDPYMAKRIGSDVLINLLFQYLPVGKGRKERVKEIISIFGTYLLLSLMEACRPIDLQNAYKPIENKTKDAIAYQWLKNLIDPVVILDSFISNFARDYDYKERNSFIEKYDHLIEKRTAGSLEAFSLKQRFVDPFSGADAYHMNQLENISQQENTKHESTSRPNFEISQERVNAIENVMSDLFPDYVMAMKLAYNRHFDLNKESIVQFQDQKYLHQSEEDLFT